MTLINQLDEIFSTFIRLRDADDNGICCCCYCGEPVYWRTANCCHFVPRKNMSTRWDEYNCHAGDLLCNKHDDHLKYRRWMVDTYGEEIVSNIEEKGHKTYKYTLAEIKGLIEYYKLMVKSLKKIKNCERLF